MKYCENCRALCQEDECQICGSTDTRDVQPDDYCFMTECDENFGGLLKYTLADMDIPCALMPFGNGARSAFGLNLGNFRVFVQYQNYETSMDVLEQLTYQPVEDLRKDLLENEEKWHINGKFAQKRIRKKFKIPENEEINAFLKQAVTQATEIADDGAISGCAEGGHYIAITINGKKVWFNSATYEIMI